MIDSYEEQKKLFHNVFNFSKIFSSAVQISAFWICFTLFSRTPMTKSSGTKKFFRARKTSLPILLILFRTTARGTLELEMIKINREMG